MKPSELREVLGSVSDLTTELANLRRDLQDEKDAHKETRELMNVYRQQYETAIRGMEGVKKDKIDDPNEVAMGKACDLGSMVKFAK